MLHAVCGAIDWVPELPPIVALSGMPARLLQWGQYPALGCVVPWRCASFACKWPSSSYVAGSSWHAPWDYLGGLLMCQEAGASIDAGDEPCSSSEPHRPHKYPVSSPQHQYPTCSRCLRTAAGRR